MSVPAGEAELRRAAAEVDRALREFVDRQPLSDFYDLVRYHLGWAALNGPPEVRPRSTLCVLACEACGGRTEAALPMAVAIALLHNFAANQEDMERERQISRGRQTVQSRWGTAQAMNAGDGMHALAKMALLEARARIPAAAILQLEEELDECSLRLCETIHQELRDGSADRAELAAGKASVLFGCAGHAGCYLAGAPPSASEGMRRFGQLLGAAAGVAALDRERSEACLAEALRALGETGLAEPKLAPMRALAEHVLRGR